MADSTSNLRFSQEGEGPFSTWVWYYIRVNDNTSFILIRKDDMGYFYFKKIVIMLFNLFLQYMHSFLFLVI